MQHNIPKILIIGSRSKIAEAIIRLILSETSWQLVLVSSGYDKYSHVERISAYPFDYSQPQSLKAIMLHELPTITINCAAMTNVDACEDERKNAWLINVNLVETIARMCKITDCQLIHFSSDYIFDGVKGFYSESDIPKPLSYYGKTKLASENVCRISGIQYTIIRTNVVYGFSSYSHADFVEWILNKLNSKTPFSVVTDQVSNPTFTDDIARAVVKIIKKQRQGIYNVGGADWVSRFEFAKKIARIFHFDELLISPMLTSELTQNAKRPLKSGLLTLKAETDLDIKFSSVEAGLICFRHQRMTAISHS